MKQGRHLPALLFLYRRIKADFYYLYPQRPVPDTYLIPENT